MNWLGDTLPLWKINQVKCLRVSDVIFIDTSERFNMFRYLRILLLSIPLLGALAGCSATTLRCSSSAQGDSFVEMINLPQDLSGQVRNYANLCGFVYEKQTEPVARLNILDSAALVAEN